MASCKALLEQDDEAPQDDLQCMVCLEPLQEARRFNCFHLLCAACAERHVTACLSLSEGQSLAFGPVFCPQCREVSYVWPAAGRHLPECAAVAAARREARSLLAELKEEEEEEGPAAEDAAAEQRLGAAAERIDDVIASAMTSVRELLKEEHDLQERAFEWAAESDLVSNRVAFSRSDWMPPECELASLRAEFGPEVSALVCRRGKMTRQLERLFRRRWVLALLHSASTGYARAAEAWEQFDERFEEEKEEEEEEEEKEDEEARRTRDEEENLFLLSAVFRSHRPYPGAVLPEHRVKPGQICAELVWVSGLRGSEPGNFEWPVHATFLDRGDCSSGRIAVADKNNKRVQLLDRDTGKHRDTLFCGQVIPRRVHRHRDLLLVSDELSACVKAFDMETWKLKGRFGKGLFLCPTGVANQSDGTLLYTDMDRGFVSSHNSTSLELKQKWTCRLLCDRYLPSPAFLTVDADDYIFIADSQNNCVKVFKPNGGIVARFGSEHLCCPRGIFADPLGHIFVVDSDHHRICVFDPHGKFLQELLLECPIEYPMSLDYLPEKRLLLITQCSFFSYNHSVMLFKLDYNNDVKAIEAKDVSLLGARC